MSPPTSARPSRARPARNESVSARDAGDGGDADRDRQNQHLVVEKHDAQIAICEAQRSRRSSCEYPRHADSAFRARAFTKAGPQRRGQHAVAAFRERRYRASRGPACGACRPAARTGVRRFSRRSISSRLPVGSSAMRSFGSRDKRAGDRDALLLAARNLRRIMRQARRQPDLRQASARDRERIAPPGEFERRGDVLERRHGRHEVEILENDADIRPTESRHRVFVQRPRDRLPATPDRAGGRLLETGEKRQQACLAGAGRTDDRHGLAFGDGESESRKTSTRVAPSPRVRDTDENWITDCVIGLSAGCVAQHMASSTWRRRAAFAIAGPLARASWRSA